ncbi:MAG: GGDEF domain-containing protein [Lachnospiraceae bacterium]|nr:GGDEF domain-containing protein [Lachnospiraceae bacterium]
MGNDKNYTIGFIVSGITDPYTESLCRGAFREGKKNGVNIITVPGKYLNRNLIDTPEIMYEYQYNTIFYLPSPENMDALVIAAGCLGCFTSEERVRELLDYYKGIPILLVSSDIDGYINVTYDNYSGVRDGINYLIDNKDCKKFVVLTGPDGNSDATERKDAAVSVIKARNAELLGIVEGFMSGDNHFASEKVLDRYPEADACICVNDDTALDLCKCMKKRGLEPGKDLRIVGYDNTIEGAKATPSLATVNADPILIGEKAVKTIIKILNGENVENIDLPAQFIPRSSVGNVIRDDTEDASFLNHSELDKYYEAIFYRHASYSREDAIEIHKNFIGIMDEVIYCVDKELPVRTIKNKFVELFDNLINDTALDRAEIEDMIIFMEKLHKVIREKKHDGSERYELRDLFAELYIKLVTALDAKIGKNNIEQFKTMYNLKLFVKDSLNFSVGGDVSYGKLLKCLRRLGVNNGAVYTFKKPVMHLYMEDFNPPRHMYLKATMVNGLIHNIPANSQIRRRNEWFNIPNLYDEAKNFVVFPLFYNEYLYGVIICEFNDILYSNGDFLTNQLGAAMRMIELLKTNEAINRQLEDNLLTLKEHNIELDTLSKTDALTGIFNRRGFEEDGNSWFESNKKKGDKILVSYVDMNNLKIINDRFGHDSGDFAIKLISDILRDEISDHGIFGRIGGDEFAFVRELNSESVDDFVKKLKGRFDDYNKASDKEFNVTVSVGTKLVECTDDCDLSCALAQADVSLYDDKQKKPTTVVKAK